MKYSVSVSTKMQVLVLSSFGEEVVLVHLSSYGVRQFSDYIK